MSDGGESGPEPLRRFGLSPEDFHRLTTPGSHPTVVHIPRQGDRRHLHHDDVTHATERALGDGAERATTTTVRVRRVRISVCGQCGTGKSSFCDTLRGERHQKARESTLLLTVAHDRFLQTDGGGLQSTRNTPVDLLKPEIAKTALEMQRRRKEALDAARQAKQQLQAEMKQQQQQQQRDNNPEPVEPHLAPAKRKPQASQEPKPKAASKEKPTPAADPAPEPEPEQRAAVVGKTPPAAPAKTTSPKPAANTLSDEIAELDRLKQQLIDDIVGNPDLMRDVNEEEVIVSVWDCGGQTVFSSMQHFLMGEEYVVYVICFNASEPFDARKTEEFVRPETYERLQIPVSQNLKNVDHIRHWLTAIHFASDKPSAAGSADQQPPPSPARRSTRSAPGVEDRPAPPIIMVGTFADKLLEKSDVLLEEHKSRLWRELDDLCINSPMYDAIFDDDNSGDNQKPLFLVDNWTKEQVPEQKQEVNDICKRLQSAISNVLAEQKISPRWVRFEWILQFLNRGKDLIGYVDRAYIGQLAGRACGIYDDQEIEDMLVFYDRLRLIIYKPRLSHAEDAAADSRSQSSRPSDIIIFDTSWLIKQINLLIFGPRFMGGDENQKTMKWRKRLWEDGVLESELIAAAWRNIRDRGVRDSLIRLLVAWKILYEYPRPKGSGDPQAEYFVPSALMKKPDRAIPEELRRDCGGHGGVPAGEEQHDDHAVLSFSTADTPLLIMAHPKRSKQPSHAGSPFPHSSFFKLLVSLMTRWGVEMKNTSRFTYNTAWFEIPHHSLGLDNVVDGASVDVFLAHYESSGALLLSLRFQHPVQSFRDGHLALQRGGVMTTSGVCCQVRRDVLAAISGLRDPPLPSAKLFAVQFPPSCECGDDWCDEETGSCDLGYAPWKIALTGAKGCDLFDALCASGTGCAHASAAAPAPVGDGQCEVQGRGSCTRCHKKLQLVGNSRCWFSDQIPFTLDGPMNGNARDVMMRRRALGCGKQASDPWSDPRFSSDFFEWFLSIHPEKLRESSIKIGLITMSDGQNLQHLHASRAHNAELLGIVRARQRKSFEQFLDVLSDLGMDAKRAQLETLL